MGFSPVKRAKVADQVADSIREAIVGGEYAPGDALPGERDLAGQFEVNRSSIREALHRLEAWGLVEIRHGTGARVSDFLANASLQLLPFLLAPGGQIDAKLLRDLLEIRAELLGFTAAQAAPRCHPGALEPLETMLYELEHATTTRRRQELDFDFFQELVRLSDNQVLGMLINGIRKVYLQNRNLFEQMYEAGFDTRHHRRTLDALRDRDPARARAAMQAYGQSALS